ncbi:MAG TPA: tetratricopeptide repeat protein, partial [Ktedonobacteraceae bacterium]
MPFISGGTLQGILDKQQGFLEQDQVIFYFECMCTALDYAHKKEIAHLDLKPQNFLVHENGELLLSDFGLARLLKQGRITGGSSLRSGTPHYMAPEHIKGSPEKRSDLFSLGVILYQMLVGRLPFDELPGETILLKNMMEWPPAPRELRPDLPEAVEDMLAKALAKRPEQRYQTANEFLMAFKNALKRDLQIVVHQPPDTLGTQRKPLTDMFDGKAPQPEGHAPEQSRGNVAPLPPISPNREQTRPGDYQQMEKEWLQEAKGHCAARRYDEALAGYQHILRLNPQSVEAHMQLAYIYSDRQQYDEALSALKQASPVVPDDPSILMFHADLLSGLKRSQEALDTYEQILSLAPDHMPAMVGRVKLLRLLGRHEEALTACEGILSRDPGHLDAQQWKVALLHQLATAHYKRGKELVAEKRLLGKPYKLYSQALAAFDQAIQFDPSFAAAYRERGDLLKALKRPTEALGAYDTAIELGMNDFATWIKTGHVLLQQKAYAQALKRAERAEEQIAPDSIDRDQRLAEVYVIKMKALKGLELIDEAGKLRERLPGLLNE